ncbi:hypothetical protein T484DRAFT_3521452 [Baffinella frigidus]|nr:hypothetical protein T484DRAFT_3521452 [Cryptophyta sp. CCMP2293]
MDKAIFEAFHGDFEEMMDRLSVASMNAHREADGCTPLMAACARGNAPVALLLLDLNCNSTLKDSNGLMAEDHAMANKHAPLREMIASRMHPKLGPDNKAPPRPPLPSSSTLLPRKPEPLP